MKKFLTVMVMLLLCSNVFADNLTYGPTYFRNHYQYQENSTSNPVYLFINEVDGIISGSTLTFANGGTFDNATDNKFEWNENSDELVWTFGSNTITASSGDVTLFDFGTIVLGFDQFKVNATTYTFPTSDSTGTQYLASDGSGTLSWGSPSATFTGGNITSDCTLSDGVDLQSTTTDGQAATIKVYDNDTGPDYTNVLSWTNGNTPAIAMGSDTSTFALNSTTIDITAGAITGVTTLDTSGAVTVGGALSANSWTIGSGAFSTTGTTTLGDGTGTVAVASSSWDISTAGAISGVTTLGMSGDLTISAGDVILANGQVIKSSTTTAETVAVQAYDVDNTTYRDTILLTNGDTIAFTLGTNYETVAINSSDWDISTTGAMTGIGDISISEATPTVTITDSDAGDGDAGVTLVGAATDTTSGQEDVDLTISQQIAGTLRAVGTFDADGNITFGYGTQNVVATADVTVTGGDLTLDTAGVKLTGDGDGAITFLGLGDGADEDLSLNLDDTANKAVWSETQGIDEWILTDMGIDVDKVEVSSTTPQAEFYDTDCGDGDVSAEILVAATTTTSDHEDIDVTMIQQSDGSDHNFIYSDGDGNLELDSAAGIIDLKDTATFSGGQTRKVRFDPKVVELDGTNPPTLDDVGTDAQANISALQFAATGAADDDICYISWLVPDGYVVDSARLNVCYTFSDAEDAADEAQFDFAVNAVAAGETLDAAGTALADQMTVITDASTGQGKLYITQYNIEVEAIAVDDLVTIEIAVDNSASALANSGTLDVLYLEIEYESDE